MKKLMIILSVASVIAAPAFAQGSTRHRAKPVYGAARIETPRAAMPAHDTPPGASTVIIDGQYIGQDPDPNVRLELRRDQSEYLGNSY